MRRLLLATLLAIPVAPAVADDVSLSVAVNEPGFYGQINIGNAPQPRVIYARPVVIERGPEVESAPPMYLHVPPGHEKHWRKHCAEYNACGRPVYFVRHDWYEKEYLPRQRHDDDRGEKHHKDHDRGHDHEHGHGKNRDEDRDH